MEGEGYTINKRQWSLYIVKETLTQKLAAHNKKNVKAKWIILDAIKDYLILRVGEEYCEGDFWCRS